MKKDGFPYLTVLDAEGKAVANQASDVLEVHVEGTQEQKLAAGHDPKAVLKFLKDHEASALDASAVLKDGLTEAKSSGRSVFLHFGAPWCGWCRRLEAWMASPDVAKLLAKDFVDVKIDSDRYTGGQEMLVKFSGSEKSGIPWFAFLDGEGKVIADSNTAAGNTGFPSEPSEVAHFSGMLKKAAKNLTKADLAALMDSLKADGKKAGTPH